MPQKNVGDVIGWDRGKCLKDGKVQFRYAKCIDVCLQVNAVDGVNINVITNTL